MAHRYPTVGSVAHAGGSGASLRRRLRSLVHKPPPGWGFGSACRATIASLRVGGRRPGRGDAFVGQHYVTVIQHGDRLTVRSLPGSSDSPLTMDLTLDGSVVTGTWVEQTSPDSYYRGARYHGAIQLLAEPTGRHMVGKWVGFGKEMDVNTGPWELIFQDGSTDRATLERPAHHPERGQQVTAP